MTTTIEGIKTISRVPGRGEWVLSVNLALVDLTAITDIARELGFNPQIVVVKYRDNLSEIHALLWQGPISEAPADMDDLIDRLADLINTDAIHSRRGAWTAAA